MFTAFLHIDVIVFLHSESDISVIKFLSGLTKIPGSILVSSDCKAILLGMLWWSLNLHITSKGHTEEAALEELILHAMLKF